MKAIFTCGGTGGHIYPAIAIANKIKEQNPSAQILFIGTKKGMENRLVPQAGYDIKGVDASGFNRRNLLKNFETFKNFCDGSHQAEQIIKEFQPDFVVGTGGYVTGIVVRKAAKMGIPCYIHEQNAFPGMANKILEQYVENVFISFEEAAGYFKNKDKIILSGNPVRAEFVNASRTDHQGFKLLVCGGSLGAEAINNAALQFIASKPQGVYIDFVTGKRYYEGIKAKLSAIEGASDFVNLIDYENDMPGRMATEDLAISRSGAITLSETLAMGLPTIFVPSPNVTGNHQYHNAKAAADKGAAILIEEKELTANPGILGEKVLELAAEKDKLQQISKAAKAIAITDAADTICKTISKK